MEKSESKKLIPLYLQELFLSKTDKDHFIRMPEILSFLETKGIYADRRTVYSAITNLNIVDFVIEGKQERGGYKYHHPVRLFSCNELKFLVDSVAASRFLTEKKSKELINKIKSLASDYEVKELNRDIITHRRIKSMTDGLFENLDRIYKAISGNRQIEFKYLRWNANRELETIEKTYTVSPCAVSLSAENYYLIAYDMAFAEIRHYRIDKMKFIKITEALRVGLEEYKSFNVIEYSQKAFNMYGGEEDIISLVVDNSLMGVFVERFGDAASYRPNYDRPDTFIARIKAFRSPQFYAWVFALGQKAKIISPDTAITEYKEMVKGVLSEYE